MSDIPTGQGYDRTLSRGGIQRAAHPPCRRQSVTGPRRDPIATRTSSPPPPVKPAITSAFKPAFTLSVMGAFTLVELMVTLTILSILLGLGVPAMHDMLARNRLKTAAQALVADLQWLRGESIMRHHALYLTIDPEAWCYGISLVPNCDCRLLDPTVERACTLPIFGESTIQRVSGDDFRGIDITSRFPGSPSQTRFDPRRGTAGPGRLTFRSERGEELDVVLSMLGRVRLCSPSRPPVPGVPAC